MAIDPVVPLMEVIQFIVCFYSLQIQVPEVSGIIDVIKLMLLDSAGEARDVRAVVAVDRRVGGTVDAQPAVANVAGRKWRHMDEGGICRRFIRRVPREQMRSLALCAAKGSVDHVASKDISARTLATL
jgi:hypothetical protein